MNKGVILAILAYFLWGLSPVYWKLYQTVPVDEVLAHRCIWTFVFMWALMIFKKDWHWVVNAFKQPRSLAWPAVAATLLAGNWYVYTWAITNNQVVEASLGYFINPLVSLFLGVMFLKEQLTKPQAVSFIFAFIGVAIFTWTVGSLPWVSLALAFSFGFYGLLKKKVRFQPAQGMSLETGLYLIPAVAYLWIIDTPVNQTTHPLLLSGFDWVQITTGLATGLPLLFFAGAAQHLRLISIGIFQYIAPTLQFLLGVFLYNESFTQMKLIGFVFIWLGLGVFTFDLFRRTRKARN